MLPSARDSLPANHWMSYCRVMAGQSLSQPDRSAGPRGRTSFIGATVVSKMRMVMLSVVNHARPWAGRATDFMHASGDADAHERH